jgi:hypothetical protein
LAPRLGTVGTDLLPGQGSGKSTKVRKQGTALHEGADYAMPADKAAQGRATKAQWVTQQ